MLCRCPIMADGDQSPDSPKAETNQGNPSSETNAASSHPDPETKEEPKQKAVIEEKSTEDTKTATELEKYWKAVKDNPGDFTGWTYLLQYVEQENQIDAAREAFNAFFLRYPYCYGYWKKLADLESKHENHEEAKQVYEHGLKAIPLSVDLWLHYINHIAALKKNKNSDQDADKELRGLYERAITAAGTDFRSDKLWDSYIAWEKEKKQQKNVTSLYDRLIVIPTQLYSHHFDNFKEHVNKNLPKEILSLDEFLKLRQEVLSNVPGIQPDAPGDDDTDGPPGVDCAPTTPGTDTPLGEDVPPGLEAEGTAKATETEITALRLKIIELRQMVHMVTEEEVSKRWNFEEAIRRPYFHVKPLERTQLKNWREYLDFEIEHGSHERVVVLFERCMIACALYEDFWLKYAKYMEPHSVDGVRHVFRRACKIHLPKKPAIHLAWAAFEERQGNYELAAQVLQELEDNMPGLAMLSLRRISLERRQGNFRHAEELYNQYMEKASTDDAKSFFAIKFARYQAKVLGNLQRAQDILHSALEKDKNNHKLYLQLIDMEYQKSTLNEGAMLKLFDKAIENDLPIEHRVAFSQRKLEFLEDFGCNITRILDVYEEHQKLLKELQTVKKRKAFESPSAVESYQPEDKKAKLEGVTTNGTGDAVVASTTPTTAPADPNAAYNYNSWAGYSQNAAGYNYQHPGWYGSHYYAGQ